jgi:hypothetical protein
METFRGLDLWDAALLTWLHCIVMLALAMWRRKRELSPDDDGRMRSLPFWLGAVLAVSATAGLVGYRHDALMMGAGHPISPWQWLNALLLIVAWAVTGILHYKDYRVTCVIFCAAYLVGLMTSYTYGVMDVAGLWRAFAMGWAVLIVLIALRPRPQLRESV